MKYIKIIIGLVLGVLIFPFLAGCDSKSSRSSKESAESGVLVHTVLVERKTITHTIDFAGILQPIQEAKLSTPGSGIVKRVSVKRGDWVRKGQELARMTSENLDQVDARLKVVTSEWERAKKLLETETIAQAQFDRIQAEYESTSAAHSLARRNTVIEAPFAGEILDLTVKENEVFSPMIPGASYVAYLVNTDTLKMDIAVPDKYISMIERGQRVLFTIDTTPDTLEGYVFRINRSANPMTGSFAASLYLPNKITNRVNGKNRLSAGVFATAHIIAQESADALVVPQNAIVEDSTLFLVKKGKSRRFSVKTGIQNPGNIEILSTNIQEKDTVIVQGNIGMKDGLTVNIIKHVD